MTPLAPDSGVVVLSLPVVDGPRTWRSVALAPTSSTHVLTERRLSRPPGMAVRIDTRAGEKRGSSSTNIGAAEPAAALL